jgi:hemoglobin
VQDQEKLLSQSPPPPYYQDTKCDNAELSSRLSTNWQRRWKMITPVGRASGYVAVGIMVLATCGVTSAEQPSAAPTAEQQGLNKQITATLREVHDRGADLYNNRDTAGCYRLFQGGLIAVRGMLGHRPDLQQTIDNGLAEADRSDSVAARAYALHGLIEQVRKELRSPTKDVTKGDEKPAAEPSIPKSRDVPAPGEGKIRIEKQPGTAPSDVKPPAANPPAMEEKGATLWARLGGDQNVRKIVNDFVALAADDPKVDFTRAGKYKLSDEAAIHLKRELIDFISQASGGPYHYTGRNMKEAHKGMGVTNDQFDASVADLKKALQKNGVKPTDIDAVLGAVEGTRKDIVESGASSGGKP